MADINCFTATGRLTKAPELRHINDKKVCSFTLACQQNADKTDFINCVAWNQTAELLERYVSKGDRLGVTGKVTTRSYDDQTGRKVYVTEILVREISFLQSRGEAKPVEEDKPTMEVDADEDLPF